MRRLGQDGFTLQELLVTTAVLVAIVVPSTYLAKPKNYGPQQRNAERQVAVAEVIQAIHGYIAQYGSLPNGITKTLLPIGSLSGQLNLCAVLVPQFLKTLPSDPLLGSSIHCIPKQQYTTGYAIEKTGKGNQVTVAALLSEGKLVYLTD
jgi:hypothetical protein